MTYNQQLCLRKDELEGGEKMERKSSRIMGPNGMSEAHSAEREFFESTPLHEVPLLTPEEATAYNLHVKALQNGENGNWQDRSNKLGVSTNEARRLTGRAVYKLRQA